MIADTIDLLTAARARAAAGWTTGVRCDSSGHVCVLGAIDAATVGSVFPQMFRRNASGGDDEATLALCQDPAIVEWHGRLKRGDHDGTTKGTIPLKHYEGYTLDGSPELRGFLLASYNNTTSQADVLALMDRTIARLRAAREVERLREEGWVDLEPSVEATPELEPSDAH